MVIHMYHLLKKLPGALWMQMPFGMDPFASTFPGNEGIPWKNSWVQ
jgi:hypothetical protein